MGWFFLPSRRERKERSRATWASLAIAAALLIFAAFGLLLLAAVITPLPRPQIARATEVYDARGLLITKLFVENRTPVTLNRVPRHLQQAMIAVEDPRFYTHFGVDPLGILRAAAANLRAHKVVEGGSTITQQLARNLYLGRERTLGRKLRELFLTLQLEARYSKQEILELYVNQIYLGSGTYGVQAASQLYFGKDVDNVTLTEAALLAGLPRGPELYAPLRNPELARTRRNFVLDRMVERGYLTAARGAEARATPLALAKPRPSGRAAYFVDYMMREIRERHPELEADIRRGGYRVYTTMDLAMQEVAEKSFNEGMLPARPDARGVPQPQGALVAIDPRNGYIKALVGGRDPENASYNRVVDAHRQPGSAFKPFLYAALLSRGYTATDQQMSDYVSFPGLRWDKPYVPTNYTEGGRKPPYQYRPLGMREAIEMSDNVVAVKWASVLGPATLVNYAHRLGIESQLEPSLPLALGTSEVTPLEMAAAYAPFANMGWKVKPMAIRRLVDKDGQVIEENAPQLTEVMNEGVAYILTDIMKGVIARGTAANLAPLLDRPAAGKTGTTDQNDNAWFVGYTPDLVAAVWVGNDYPSPLPGFGSTLAGPIWARFVSRALASQPPRDFTRPGNVVKVAVSAADGLLANPTSPVVLELYLRGTEPVTVSPLFRWGPPMPGTNLPEAGTPGTPVPGAPAPGPGGQTAPTAPAVAPAEPPAAPPAVPPAVAPAVPPAAPVVSPPAPDASGEARR